MDIRKGHHYSLVILLCLSLSLSLARARALVISPSYMAETHAVYFRAARRARRSKNIKFVRACIRKRLWKQQRRVTFTYKFISFGERSCK